MDELHRDTCVNFITMLDAARQAFEARDFEGAQRKLKAADAVAERVKSRKERAA